MGDEQAGERRVRICKRADGVVFTWSPVLDAMSNMRPGWLTIAADGTRSVSLDAATLHDLDARTMSRREQDLIDENARLRADLAQANGLPPASPDLQPGESVITDLTEPKAGDEVPLALTKPQVYSASTLQSMRKEDLVSHVHSLDEGLSLPDHLTKQDLVTLCMDLQNPIEGD